MDKTKRLLPTRKEMSFPDWRKRLARAKRESGTGMPLEKYLKQRKAAVLLPKPLG